MITCKGCSRQHEPRSTTFTCPCGMEISTKEAAETKAKIKWLVSDARRTKDGHVYVDDREVYLAHLHPSQLLASGWRQDHGTGLYVKETR